MDRPIKKMMYIGEFNLWVKRMLHSFNSKEPELLTMIEDAKSLDRNGITSYFCGAYFKIMMTNKKAIIINYNTLQTASIKINRNRTIDYSEIFAALWAKYNSKPIPTKMPMLSELDTGTKFKFSDSPNIYVYIGENTNLNRHVCYNSDTEKYYNFINSEVIPFF